MSVVQRYFLVLLITLCITAPVKAVKIPLDTDLEEINHHQAAASAALIMGDHTLLEPGKYAVSGDVYMSNWGYDALYGAWGLSVQAKPWQNLGLGLSYGFTDAQLRTRSWLLNAQFSPLSGSSKWLQMQAAVGYQFLDSSESGNVIIFESENYWPIRPGNPEILLDDMTWINGYWNVMVNTLLWRFRPQASLGYIYSHYSWSGNEIPLSGGLDAGLGPAISDSGNTETVNFTMGIGLDLGPVRPYVGLGVFTGGGLFLARLTIVF